MAASVAATLGTLLTAGADVSNGPTSVFTDTAAGPTAAMVVLPLAALEQSVLDAGVKLEGARMAYLVDSEAYAAAKGAAQVADVSALFDNRDKTINGYFAFVSSNVGNGGTAGKDHALLGLL